MTRYSLYEITLQNNPKPPKRKPFVEKHVVLATSRGEAKTVFEKEREGWMDMFDACSVRRLESPVRKVA